MNTTRTTYNLPRSGEEAWPKYGLFLLGLSVTMYLDLFVVAGLDVRPVQLVPVVIALIAMPVWPSIVAKVPRSYLAFPCLWAGYMLVRHAAFDVDGQLTCARTLVNVMAYLGALTLLMRSGRISWLLTGLLMGTLISVTLALADISLPQMVTSSVRMSNGRWQGLMPGANRFANLCAIASITGIGLLSIVRLRAYRLIIGLTTAGALLGLAMSGSRGATLTTAVSVVFLLWLTGRAKGRLFFTPRIIAFSVMAIILSVGLFSYYRDFLPERLVSLIQSPDDALALIEDDVRRDLFEIAFEIFLESPMIGAGASAAFFTLPTAHGEIEISSHNMYLKLLSTSGIVGLVGYLSLPTFILLRLGSRLLMASASRAPRISLAPLALTWLLLILSHGIVISIGQTTHVWLLFAATAYVCIQQTEGATARRNVRPQARASGHPLTPTRTTGLRRTFG